MKILSFGEIIWDIYPDNICFGGAALNFSAHVAKCGAEAYLLSSVGDDELGAKAFQKIEEYDVKSDFVVINKNKPSGQCLVTLDKYGVPAYNILSDVAYDYIGLPDGVDSIRFDAVAFGSLALRSHENLSALNSVISKKICGKIYCDLNLRAPFYNEEIVRFCLRNAEILKLSETELEYVGSRILKSESAIYEELIKALCQRFPNLQTVLLTCGEKGAYAYVANENLLYFCPAQTVEVVSTVGAGDSFGAVFLVNYLQGVEISECLQRATERSVYVISHFEAVPD